MAIARAFAAGPDLVICDEPVSSLDVSVQGALMNLLLDLQGEAGTSYLFISHDLAAVQHLSHLIGVMYLGKLVEQGEAAQVLSPPYHPYTEALLSAVPDPDLTAARPRRVRLRGQRAGRPADERPCGLPVPPPLPPVSGRDLPHRGATVAVAGGRRPAPGGAAGASRGDRPRHTRHPLPHPLRGADGADAEPARRTAADGRAGPERAAEEGGR